MDVSRKSIQIHPLLNGLTTQEITEKDPTFHKLRSEAKEVSFRGLCPEIPNTTYLTHGVHPYPAKFIPQIPRYFIVQNSQPGDTVLDPFAGSGTALVEASILCRNSIGGDVNPLAPLLWDVKTFHDDEITGWRFELAEFYKFLRKGKVSTPPDVPNIRTWFDEGPIQDLSRIFQAIHDFPFSSVHLKNFVLVCASSTVRRVSRADPKIGKPFVSKHMRKLFETGPIEWKTLEVFRGQIEKYLGRVSSFYRLMKGRIASEGFDPRVISLFPQDARTLPDVRPKSIDVAITSPPYANAQEYFRTVKLELFWLGLATAGSLPSLDRKILGTERVPAKDDTCYKEMGIPSLDPGLKRVYEIDSWRWRVAFEYFAGLRAHFHRMAEVMKIGGKYGFLIGDNTLRRVPLPVHVGVIQIAEEEGLRCTDKVYDRIVSRALSPNRNNSAGLIDVEWLLTFEVS